MYFGYIYRYHLIFLRDFIIALSTNNQDLGSLLNIEKKV